jgi:hypothetical protein
MHPDYLVRSREGIFQKRKGSFSTRNKKIDFLVELGYEVKMVPYQLNQNRINSPHNLLLR